MGASATDKLYYPARLPLLPSKNSPWLKKSLTRLGTMVPAVSMVLLWAALLPSARGAYAQWNLDGNLNSGSGGSNLVAGFVAPETATGVSFSSVPLGDTTAQVAGFTRGTVLRLTHGLGSNGSGTYLNKYTILMDVMFPARTQGRTALLQNSAANADDAEWFVNSSGALGVAGVYGGSIPDGIWHRLALVVDTAAGTLTSFIDGTQASQVPVEATLDGRWALRPAVLLFADDSQENSAGFVNSIQVRNEVMLAEDIQALGGPTAAGIPIPIAPTLQLTTPNGGESFLAGSTQLVSWTSLNPVGAVTVNLYHSNRIFQTVAQVPMLQSNFNWVIDGRLGDTNDYRIRLVSVSYPTVQDFSDGMFSVSGSVGKSARYGQLLQVNGGFEELLAGWQIVTGHPTTLTTGAKGSPHAGTRFYHGGMNPAGDSVLRQDLDVLALGFSPLDIDLGCSVDAQAWLRNFYGAGTFDDQVYFRVAYLDAAGQETASLRCIIPGNNAWTPERLTGWVPAGTRTLRVEIVGRHRRDPDNDSMADDVTVKLLFAAPATPHLLKRPMLQEVRTNAMSLLWETDGNQAVHAVEWGRSNVNEHTSLAVETLQIDTAHYVQRATLTGLETETSYVYRVRSGATVSPIFSFRTAPRRDTPFVAAWWGDNHGGTDTLRTHIGNLLAHAPDLVLVAGDLVNSGGNPDEWHNYWFKPLEYLNCAQTRPVIFARGNHDGEHALAYAYSKLPGNESWFAFDYGNTRFIFLDTEAPTSDSPEQFAWLQAELDRPETQRAAFRVVCFHRPPFVNLWNGGGHTGETWVQSDWVGLFGRKNVDLVISGHSHAYNRGTTNGVTYVVSGGGGGTVDTEVVARWPFFVAESSRFHFDLMEVNGDTLFWQTFDDGNQLLDQFTLKSRVSSVTWEPTVAVGNEVPLLLSGRSGTSYVLEQSVDLGTWTPVVTNTLPASGRATNLVRFDPGAAFFRARELKP